MCLRKTTPESCNSHAKFEIPTVTPSTTVRIFLISVMSPAAGTMALCAKIGVSHALEINVCLATLGKIDVTLNELKKGRKKR